MSRRARERKPKGFSERPFKGAYNMIFRKFDVKGSEKKECFNDLALYMAIGIGVAAGLAAGALSAVILGAAVGVIVGILAGIGAFSLAADWMVKDRFWRP